MKRVNIFLATVALLSCNLFGYVRNEIDHWKKGDQHIFCLRDRHEENESSWKQRFDLLAIARKLDAQLIVEDMDVVQRDVWAKQFAGCSDDACALAEKNIRGDAAEFIRSQNKNTDFLSLDLTPQPLWGLTAFCKAVGIDCISAEFRLRTQDQLDELMYGTVDQLVTYLKSTDVLMEQIQNYNDGEVLKKHYNQIISDVKNKVLKPAFEFFTHLPRKGNVLQAVTGNPRLSDLLYWIYEREELLNGFKQETAATRAKTLIGTMSDEEKLSMFLTIFNSFLVDLKILHELVHCPKKNVVVYAGGYHITESSTVLPALGYKKVTQKNDQGDIFEPIDLVEYFKKIYGEGFQSDLKPHIDFVLSTTTEKLPKHHTRRYETWMNMVTLERDRWGAIDGKADFGLFDSFKIMLYPKDLVNTFTAFADSAKYVYNAVAA